MIDIMGTKDRTIDSYALIGMAVKYIYEYNTETFHELGHTWEEMVREFLPGKFRDAVRLSHPEISRPDLLLKNYLSNILHHAKQLTISQVRNTHGQSTQVILLLNGICSRYFIDQSPKMLRKKSLNHFTSRRQKYLFQAFFEVGQ